MLIIIIKVTRNKNWYVRRHLKQMLVLMTRHLTITRCMNNRLNDRCDHDRQNWYYAGTWSRSWRRNSQRGGVLPEGIVSARTRKCARGSWWLLRRAAARLSRGIVRRAAHNFFELFILCVAVYFSFSILNVSLLELFILNVAVNSSTFTFIYFAICFCFSILRTDAKINKYMLRSTYIYDLCPLI